MIALGVIGGGGRNSRRKVVCRRGHLLDGAYVDSKGRRHRRCLTCHRNWERERQADPAYRQRRNAKSAAWAKENPDRIRASARRYREKVDWAERQRRLGLCMDCSVPRVAGRTRCAAHLLKRRWIRRERDSNVSFEQFVEALARQDNACAICRRSDIALHADHDHNTGLFRAVLCHLCNRAIGLLQDNPALCEAAANYLKSHGRS
jgi:hypothetical protein